MSDPGVPAPDLVDVGWSPRIEALRSASPAVGEVGRVSRVDSESCLVVTASGELVAASRPLPAVGDWVVLDRRDEGGTDAAVVEVLARWSELARGRGNKGIDRQILAVNIDVVLIVVGLDRGVRGRRLERELLLAWDSGAVPAVVLNKADLVTVEEAEEAERLAGELAPGCEVVLVSTKTGSGVEAVRGLIRDRTAVLLGESGAGKSSLVNAILTVEDAPVGDVRSSDRKGRHTTTARDLRPIPGGGVLIDMPGLRAVGLATGDGLADAYADVVEIAEGCRFRDCTHRVEPGCAVRAAVRSGALDPERLAGYERMVDELAELEARAERRAQAPPKRSESPTRGGGNQNRHRAELDP